MMKHVLKFRWALMALWIVGAVILTIFTPNLQQLVAEKGQITVPDNYRSKQANKLLLKMSDNDTVVHDLVLLFRNENGLTENDKQNIKIVIDELKSTKDKLEISSILDFTEEKEIED